MDVDEGFKNWGLHTSLVNLVPFANNRIDVKSETSCQKYSPMCWKINRNFESSTLKITEIELLYAFKKFLHDMQCMYLITKSSTKIENSIEN